RRPRARRRADPAAGRPEQKFRRWGAAHRADTRREENSPAGPCSRATECRVDLVGRDWRRADEEDGVEAHLTAHRDGHADIAELPAARDEATIEALNLAVPDLQVERELLLHGELAADLVRSGPRHAQLLIAGGNDPVHVGDRVGVEQAVESGGRENEGSSNAGREEDRTHARSEAALLVIAGR